ncbi:MAG: DEAD/DEAH box helicase [Lachnospiraceae bacterium]|nr:DEAD/DEAH box helicase [Lachnospiraceae bacterium]
MKLKNELLPHQRQAVDKLIKLKVGALFMEQGTGKTLTTLEISRIRLEKGKINAVVWLCPCSAKGNIRREIVKNCPDEMLPYFTICGIETLSSSIRALSYLLNLSKERQCFLVVDESLLIKNPRAYRTENIIKIGVHCRYKIILNGTPISRNESDLFSQFYLLDWRILGYRSYWSFSANHLEFDEFGKLRNVLNADILAKKIAPYTYQVKKEECMELPRKGHSTYDFNLTEEQNEEYMRVAEILMGLLDERRPETIYRLFSGLQAVISGKRLIFNQKSTHFDTAEIFENPLENPRIKGLLDCLTEEKAIVFCRYESEIQQLCDILPDSARFDGKVSIKAREKALKDFSEEKKYLIANRNCAGYSLNLQFCHRIIYMSNDWDLGTRLQSEDRVHRLGQEHDVEIIDICAYNTIDERILSCLWKKESLLDSIKGEIEKTKGGNLKEVLKKSIYGSRYSHEVFDCSELEDGNGQDI